MNTNQENIFTNKTSSQIEAELWALLASVPDPEVPVLSVIDLGVVRKVVVVTANPSKGCGVIIYYTPTYTGCPAIDVMKINMRMVLLEHGFTDIQFQQQLSPAWTTDWMSEAGKQKLKAYGISPPHYKQAVCTPDSFQQEEAIQCPLCNSYHTRLVSQFGSTACKALYQCIDCKEPFDYFKCH
ncbi:MAG: 1,2-phenylacetyl-CoA epoxidase subunit PaaD [Bacteroidota bacterium]